jgi:hypothetical protein
MASSRFQLRRPAALLAMILSAAAICAGCHRQYYRKQADNETRELIVQKSSHVARPPNTSIELYVDRRSRMFNPFDLDFQPMPLDDPASYAYMQCVDGRRGYPMWEAAGITNTAESPDWWQFLPLDDDGVLVLNSENAVRIALLHSPDYQREVEELYLAALAVSGERFFFDTQYFGGADTFLTTDGPRRDGRGSSSTRFEVGPFSRGRRDLSLQRRFATGAELIVGVANNIVWELSGPNSQSASTLLDFSILQPLLRNAGRDVVLENLTQSERELLARIRSFERFRRTFYLNITVGARVEVTASSAVGPVSISGAGFGVGGGGAGGFLGLLQTQLQIRNSQENIARLQENSLLLQDQLIEQLTTIPDDAGIIISQRLQVAQARQQLVTQQQNLVTQQEGFQRSIDQFLFSLGLPPYICVRLDDPFLDQFELIDRELLMRREELSALRNSVGNINVSILEMGEFALDPDTGLPVSQIQWTPELAEILDQLQQELQPLAEFTRSLLEEDLPVVEQDIAKLAESLPERQRQAERLRELYETERDSICGLLQVSQIDESIFDLSELESLESGLTTRFGGLKSRLVMYQARIEKLVQTFEDLRTGEAAAMDPRQLAALLRDDVILRSQDLVAELGDDVLNLQLIQAQARTESVVLPEVNITPEEALEIARKNRRDWANARAALVDSWRSIEVVADDLESSLDVVFSGDVQNVGNNPFKLRSHTGRLRVGLQWDAPITRILERNAYRAQLIRYERDKRTFYQFEDAVAQTLRSEIRRLQANRFTFELGRELIRNSAEQIELNADQRALRDARGQSVGPTAARDQIQALSALLGAQNGLLNIFVNYEVVRRSLDLDLGTMELTPEGLWIDPGKLSPEYLLSLPGTTAGGGMLEGGCLDCGLQYHRLPEDTYLFQPLQRVNHEGGSAVPLPSAAEAVESLDGVPVEADLKELPPLPPADAADAAGRPRDTAGQVLGGPPINEALIEAKP